MAKWRDCLREFINEPAPRSCREVTGTHSRTRLGNTVKRSQTLAGILKSQVKNSSVKWFCKQHLPVMYLQLPPQEKTHLKKQGIDLITLIWSVTMSRTMLRTGSPGPVRNKRQE